MQEDQADIQLKELEKDTRPGQYLWLGFPAIVFIWLGYGFYQGNLASDSSFDRLNALFSGLAFWGVIWAILLQKSELGFQRRELELTRQEVRGQKEQLEAQNLTMKQQRFENTFFSLLELFSGIVYSIEITRARTIGEQPFRLAKGRECFTHMATELAQQYLGLRKEHSDWDSIALCQKLYHEYVGGRQNLLGHYFRTLYNIIKFVDTSDISTKQTYINILRAQLSSSELILLFYNCISKYGSEKFKPLVERYGLLANMDLSCLFAQEHRELFDESAFHSPS